MPAGGQSAAPMLDENRLSAPFDCQHLTLREKVRTVFFLKGRNAATSGCNFFEDIAAMAWR
jgi:hypothetical protein